MSSALDRDTKQPYKTPQRKHRRGARLVCDEQRFVLLEQRVRARQIPWVGDHHACLALPAEMQFPSEP